MKGNISLETWQGTNSLVIEGLPHLAVDIVEQFMIIHGL